MKISVVIPVHNAQRTIRECLQALLKQSYTDFEVIFVNNNTTDSSCDIIEECLRNHPCLNARILHESRQGACLARNTGAKNASGEIIANIDPDCLPSPTWLQELAQEFNDQKIAAVAGNIKGRASENICEIFAGLFTLPGRTAEKIYSRYTVTHGGFPTANLAIRKKWFTFIGGFDETINYKGTGIGEDHDILARIYAQGGMVKAVPTAMVHHWHRATLKGIIQQGFLFGLAHPLLVKNHGPQGIIVTANRFEYILPFPKKGWIDFNQVDLKVVLLLLCAVMIPYGIIALTIYTFVQICKLKRRLILYDYNKSLMTTCLVLLLMIVKSVSMTFGRIKGSFLYRTLCF